ncbi:hypothetical protein MHYP_G00286160 [Metynnis hypsauchen]
MRINISHPSVFTENCLRAKVSVVCWSHGKAQCGGLFLMERGAEHHSSYSPILFQVDAFQEPQYFCL